MEILKYGAFEQFKEKHRAENELYESKRYKTRLTTFKATIITNVSAVSMILGVILVGGIQIIQGKTEVGTVIGVTNLMNTIVMPIAEVAGYRNMVNSTKPVIDEYMKYKEMEFTSGDAVSVPQLCNTMVVENLSYTYPGSEHKLFNGFSHVFESGKKYLIRGESGSGKTTLAKLLSGELTPLEGDVLIGDKSLSSLSLEALGRLVTYVEQQSYVFSDSIWNNIDFYRNSPKEKIQDIITKMKLNKLETGKVIDDESGVSGGQKARISLGRALVELPEILIVDEPTAGLDPDTAAEIIDYISSIKSTVIMISHDETAFSSDAFDEVIAI